jgi:hypothetical protein
MSDQDGSEQAIRMRRNTHVREGFVDDGKEDGIGFFCENCPLAWMAVVRAAYCRTGPATSISGSRCVSSGHSAASTTRVNSLLVERGDMDHEQSARRVRRLPTSTNCWVRGQPPIR